MRTERKMLIAAILVLMIVFNCLLPVLQVNAATSHKIAFESNLYAALKEELVRQGINVVYIDEQRTMIISDEEIARVKELSLTNKELTDLTGLDVFKNLSTLDLSSNELNKDSHLEVIGSLKNLNLLDLSSNQIEDVSMITNLDDIQVVNLHNQKFDIVEIIQLDTSNASNQKTQVVFALPQIISQAGYLDPEWLIEENDGRAYINWSGFDHQNIKVEVATSSATYQSMVTLRINISDTTNPLYNSDINMFFVVADSEERGIRFLDKNLYYAVKEQLTAYQTVNTDLITYYEGIENSSMRNLYERAYDEPQVLIIKIDDLINQISSLILSHKKIERLDGIEYLVGLDKSIDLSGNYLKSIEKLAELEGNQEKEEAILKEKYRQQLSKVTEIIGKINTLKVSINNELDKIDELNERKDELEEQWNKLEAEGAEGEAIEKVIKDFNDISVEIAEVKVVVKQLQSELSLLNDPLFYQTEKLYEIFRRTDKLASFITSDLKTMTLEDFAYLTLEDANSMLKAQIAKLKSVESALTEMEKAYLINKYQIETSTSVETEQIIKNENGENEKVIEIVEEAIENPISTHFENLITNSSSEWSLDTYLGMLMEFKLDDTYLSMVTYCYFARLFDEKLDCQAEDYVDKEIEDLSIDGFSTALLEYAKSSYYDEIIAKYDFNCSDIADEYMLERYATRIVNASQDVDTYVYIDRLRALDVSENLIESLEEISKFTKLKVLNAYDNEIINISNVDWASMNNLRSLDLGLNGISDIYPLEVLTSIEELYLKANLISGSFTFDISILTSLKILDVSENQIDDIGNLISYLTYEARANGYNDVASYLKNAFGVEFRINNQKLSMKVNGKITENQITKVELPKIFRQIEEIDYENTSFGIDSLSGNVTNDGKQVILDTSRTGTFNTVVSIIDTSMFKSIGSGTSCTIRYTVGTVMPVEVTVTPDVSEVVVGKTQQFMAEVTGENVTYTGVSWTIEGATSVDTTITEDGLLTVGIDETADEIIVRATSWFDETKSGTAVVSVSKKEVTEVILSPESVTVNPGESVELIAEVLGNNLLDEDKGIKWEMYSNQVEAQGTSATARGNKLTITIGEKETVEQFRVIAKSQYDETKFAESIVTVAVRKISEIKISPEVALVERGKTKAFTVTVNGENLREEDKTVTYTVEGNTSENTKISNNGVLTIATDETAKVIKVKATSNFDKTIVAKAIVTVNSTITNTKESIELGYEIVDENVVGVETKTPVEVFKVKFAEGYNVIVKENGEEVTTGYMKNGMFVEVRDRNNEIVKDENGDLLVYEVVVKGDVNGDGVADAIDSNLIKAIRNEVGRLSDIQLKAADLDNNGEIDISDSKLLLYHRAEVKDYCLDYAE